MALRVRNLPWFPLVTEPLKDRELHLGELKTLEWLFIAVRWLWVPGVFVLAHLHRPPQTNVMMFLGGVLALGNTAACIFNIKIKTLRARQVLSLGLLVFDASLASAIILLFVHDFYTAAYAGFVYIILEAAVRFGLVGSLGAAGFFILGLYGAFYYRETTFGLRFSVSGYVFWTLLMSVIALLVGAIVNEGRRQRVLSEQRLRENTQLAERHRLARDLHDTVLKSLHGLSLEAKSLQSRMDSSTASIRMRGTLAYIEKVCSNTIREIREVVFDLRHEEDKAGIATQLRNIATAWERDNNIATCFSTCGEDVALPQEVARHMRRVVIEALENIRRHAEATLVEIDVSISQDMLRVEIRDNGCGMQALTDNLTSFVAEGKLGIAAMKERAELIGGSLALSSGQSGTTVKLNVPLSKTSK